MKKFLTHTLCIYMLLCFSASLAQSQDTDKTTTFTEITGKVVNSSGDPVEKFTVNIQVYDYTEGGWGAAPEVVVKLKGEFEDGEFQFDVEEQIEIKEKTYINRTVTAPGFLETGQRGGFTKLSEFKGKFKDTKLSRAIKITGRLVLPAGQTEEEFVAPKVYLAKKMNGMIPDYNNMFRQNAKVDKEGKFAAIVPEDCKLNITASCDNAATSQKQFTIKKSESAEDEQDLGEIKLKEGVSVSGTVVDLDGEPVEGQIVQLQQTVKRNGNFTQSNVYGYAISDEDGKFKLPPREGKCTISLVKKAYIDGKQVKAKGDLIMAKTLEMTLKPDKPVEDIEIRESKTWKISGVVEFDKTIGMTTLVRSSSSSSQSYEVKLDENGRFEFEVVRESEPWLSIYGYKDSKMYLANMSSSSVKEFKDRFTGNVNNEGTFFQLKKVDSDIGPLEFRLLEQLVDDRSLSERLFDWYYFGE